MENELRGKILQSLSDLSVMSSPYYWTDDDDNPQFQYSNVACTICSILLLKLAADGEIPDFREELFKEYKPEESICFPDTDLADISQYIRSHAMLKALEKYGWVMDEEYNYISHAGEYEPVNEEGDAHCCHTDKISSLNSELLLKLFSLEGGSEEKLKSEIALAKETDDWSFLDDVEFDNYFSLYCLYSTKRQRLKTLLDENEQRLTDDTRSKVKSLLYNLSTSMTPTEIVESESDNIECPEGGTMSFYCIYPISTPDWNTVAYFNLPAFIDSACILIMPEWNKQMEEYEKLINAEIGNTTDTNKSRG